MKRMFSKNELPDSALRYVLEALIPYSDANLKLNFRPSAFFNDLENIGKQKARSTTFYKRQTLRNEFYKAKKNGLLIIDENGIPRLTDKARQRLRPYKPQLLPDFARLMVIFDIPEEDRWKRRHLRLLLKELEFAKVQQSVWVSRQDSRDYLTKEIRALGLQKYVQVYESLRLM